jgi:L,D-transpeptidase catalytic domain
VLKIKIRIFLGALALALAGCATRDEQHSVRISIPEQKMMVTDKGVEIARYDVSTSKFGVGDRPGSFATPLGTMEIAKKIGDGQPSGMKFHGRRPTGEIVKPDAPGRDPIVSRILWLRGLQFQNARAFDRAIYIHGTAEESKIGTPASYGCIRMRSRDVIQFYDIVGLGARVEISMDPLPKSAMDVRAAEAAAKVSAAAAKAAPSTPPAPSASEQAPAARTPSSPIIGALPPPHQG